MTESALLDNQCQSLWKEYRCELPVGHFGSHEQSKNDEVLAAWNSQGLGKEY
jgi:hypothetical protein